MDRYNEMPRRYVLSSASVDVLGSHVAAGPLQHLHAAVLVVQRGEVESRPAGVLGHELQVSTTIDQQLQGSHVADESAVHRRAAAGGHPVRISTTSSHIEQQSHCIETPVFASLSTTRPSKQHLWRTSEQAADSPAVPAQPAHAIVIKPAVDTRVGCGAGSHRPRSALSSPPGHFGCSQD